MQCPLLAEIIDAAQKAPQVVAFNKEAAAQNYKSKRDSHDNQEGQRRSKRLKENCDNGMSQKINSTEGV